MRRTKDGWIVLPTEVGGIRFRSRLEARWAIFLSALGLQWEYEPEGYELAPYEYPPWDPPPHYKPHPGPIRYLPDFWVPEIQTHLEIKPTMPDDRMLDIAMRFTHSICSGRRVGGAAARRADSSRAAASTASSVARARDSRVRPRQVSGNWWARASGAAAHAHPALGATCMDEDAGR